MNLLHNNTQTNTSNNYPDLNLKIEIPNEPRVMIPKPVLRRSQATSGNSPSYNIINPSYNLKQNKIPDYVEPDMNFGLESISCELANYLYNAYRNKLIHITSRKRLEQFIIKNYRNIRPVHLCNCERHVSQIIFALCNYYRVCRIIKNNEIEWYFVMEIPAPPEGCLNQLRLIANVTFRNAKTPFNL